MLINRLVINKRQTWICTAFLLCIIIGSWNVMAQRNDVGTTYSITLTGGMIKAITVSYGDFLDHLKELSNHPSALAQYLSSIVNYDVTIELDNGDYVVTFFPKNDIEKGIVIHGGGGRYTVSGNDYEVHQREFYK